MRTDRIERIVNNVKQHNMDQMVISDLSTIFYLTGKFVASGVRLFVLCLNTQGTCTFFINSLQTDYAPLAKGAEVIQYTDSNDSIQILAKKIRISGTVGIDKNQSSSFLLRLMTIADTKYVLGNGIIDYIHMVGDNGEIQLMRETQVADEKVVSRVFQYASPELAERKHRCMLHRMHCAHGANGYNIIDVVAYGKSCGYAHRKPDRTTPAADDCIMIDAGARPNGYRSDMTRTVFYRSVSDEMRNIYEVVKGAQLTAMGTIKLGMRFCDTDKTSRDVITKYGYGGYLTHRIGHNIGIDDHELPGVGGTNIMEVLPSMTFPAEPGIYIPNLGEVWIENLAIATGNGYECLNKMNKNLRTI